MKHFFHFVIRFLLDLIIYNQERYCNVCILFIKNQVALYGSLDFTDKSKVKLGYIFILRDNIR